ncbi:E3 ubiquitin-protein ligase UBR5-like [Oopsacas minuta]|uniref:E3 ubiquitin-protein ligase UBR5-like n=1 Tax=Oopsacas minuta TaxID=111878 RepID=A0AAV7JJC4_9METZ|nr:E3 ubiquitin-protein ligase UBR5-like [Oopsacas minuta]
MSSLACITQETGLLKSDQRSSTQLISKLNTLSLRLSDLKNITQTTHSSSQELHQIFSPRTQIIQIVISSSHIAFLLKTNEVCRVKYRVLPLPPLQNNFPMPHQESSYEEAVNSEFHSQNENNTLPNTNQPSIFSRCSTLPSVHEQVERPSLVDPEFIGSSSLGRGRGLQGLRNGTRAFNMRTLGRHPASNLRRNYLNNPGRTFRTTSEVPEDLINQAQAVLQCKNRSLISRELQRTGLDVNQAVNNLLSREDDGEEDESVSTVLGSDELLYLFESGAGTSMPIELPSQDGETFSLESSVQSLRRMREMPGLEGSSGRESRLGFSRPIGNDTHLDRLSDIILSYASIPGVNQGSQQIDSPKNDVSKRESKEREQDIQLPYCAFSKEDINSSSLLSSNVDLSPRIEFYQGPHWWVDGAPDHSYSTNPPLNSNKFTYIASTDTDLLAITFSGHLTYWPWDQPNGIYSNKEHTFPFSPNIDIKSTDRIRLLATSRFRISVLTMGNFTASFWDRTLKSKLPSSGSSLETPLHQLRLQPNHTVISLTCCDIFSACISSSGQIFWWGNLPYLDRKRAIMRIKNKFTSQHRVETPRNGGSFRSDIIREGSFVFIRGSPFYSIGTRALYLQKDVFVGTLQENLYSLNEKCRFKLFVRSGSQDHNFIPEESVSKIHIETSKASSMEHSYTAPPSFHTWHCRDVIFLEEPHFHSSPGQVVKIDGDFAIVSFPEKSVELSKEYPLNLSSSRIVKKEDLILLRHGHHNRGPICISLFPKKLNFRPDCTPVTITANNKGLYILYHQNNIPKLGIISLVTSRIENHQYFPSSMSSYLNQNPLILTLGSSNHFQSYFYIQDTHGSLLPLIKTQSNTFRDVPFIPLPPVRAFCSYYHSAYRISLIILACDNYLLTPCIVSNSPELLSKELRVVLEDQQLCKDATMEYTNGNHNILHTAIGVYILRLRSGFGQILYEPSYKLSNDETLKTKSLNMHQELSIYSEDSNGPRISVNSRPKSIFTTKSPNYSIVDSLESGNLAVDDRPISLFPKSSPQSNDPIELLINNFELDLPRLLVEINLDGFTPFMQAVHGRAYEVALRILTAIFKVSKSSHPGCFEQDILRMIFPNDSFLDDNPLFVLCANDPCSVTWTGESHETSIDIYECRTCGLVGDYCCCSECSRVCHKGHDCKKKLQPMKAFCDCSKLCNCKALISGNQIMRLRLLKELIQIGKLQTMMNSHGEYILNFLANTHSRQLREQTHRSPSYMSKSNLLAETEESFLFSKKALEICLSDWKTVYALFAAPGNVPSTSTIININNIHNLNIQSKESNAYLNSQQCTSHIETFLYTLLTSKSSDLIRLILSSICQAYNDGDLDAKQIAPKFLRSVIRIYLISTYEQWAPDAILTKKRNQIIQHNVQVVFRSMNKLAIKELWLMASSLVIPIQLGVVKPCDPMSIDCRKKNLADEFFKSRFLPTNSLPSGDDSEIIDSDCRSSFSDSGDSGFLINESESITTPEDVSVTTRATIGSSHIVPYISGDSTSESEEIMHEEGLDSAPELEEENHIHPLISTIESLTPPLPPILGRSIATVKSTDNPAIDLSFNHNMLNSVVDNVNLQSDINSHSISPYTLNVEMPTTNLDSHFSALNSEHGDASLRINHYSDLSWQPAFELISHRTNLSTSQHKRRQNFVTCPQDSCYPSYSHQEQVQARSFHFLIEQLIDVLRHQSLTPLSSITLEPSDITTCCTQIWYEMEPLLIWLIQVMDPLESQLRFGSSLDSPYSAFLSMKRGKERLHAKSTSNQGGDISQSANIPFDSNLTHPTFEQIPSTSTKHSIGMDSLEYLLSLTRSSFNEHREFIPPINLASMEHIGHVLDAVLYFLYNQPDRTIHGTNYDQTHSTVSVRDLYIEPMVDSLVSPNILPVLNVDSISDQLFPVSSDKTPSPNCNNIGESLSFQKVDNGYFFKRSSCMGFFGCPTPNYLAPIESIPCAEMPHILQPQTRREILFGAPQDPIIPDPDPHSPFHRMNTLTNLLNFPLIKCFSQMDRLASSRSLYKSISDYNECEISHSSLDLKRAAEVLIGRWRLSIELFCKLLYDKNRCDSIHILQLLQDFPSKEEKFREEMEKLTYRLGKDQREIHLNVSRDRTSLICDTFRQLNTYTESRDGLLTPLCVKQVKVTFKNEQGEGSGVARSFYTSFADAILSDEPLPSLVNIFTQCKNPEESWDPSCLLPLNPNALPFHPQNESSEISRDKVRQGTRLYSQVARLIGNLHSGKVTGMLLDIPTSQIDHLFNNHSHLARYVLRAYEIITDQINSSNVLPTYDDLTPSIQLSDLFPKDHYNLDHETECTTSAKRFKPSEFSELTPLFFEPGKCGFYSPRVGKYTPERKLAYLCVGRIVGLCLLTNELFPASFTRHVLKYLIGKDDTICWQDYAFMDPIGFESLRKILLLAQEGNCNSFNSLDLTFQISLSMFESSDLVELVENGSSIPVTVNNAEYYVKLYTQYRMKHVVREALLDMQLGLAQVIPITYFSNISPEELRLMLNGCNSFNMDSLKKIVIINNESKEDNKIVSKFIKWFWSLLRGFSDREKQDLLYFWTSSPKMPSSIHSYQPEPSIHIRPPEEDHLPTANTCIARMYIPLYSTRTQLKSKLLLAIKTKTFGFV